MNLIKRKNTYTGSDPSITKGFYKLNGNTNDSSGNRLNSTTLVPSSAVQHATNLGASYNIGLDVNTTWQNRAYIL